MTLNRPANPRAGLSGIVGVALLSVLGLAGCTKAGHASGPGPTVDASQSATAPESTARSGVPSDTGGPSGSASGTASVPVSSPASTTTASPTPPGPPTCPNSALSVSVQRGSGAAGHQFATLVFTNKSPATCALIGFPGVVLLESGHALGAPALRSAKPATRVLVKPGASATAELSDASTCNADNSDSVQVIAPNTTGRVILPLRLRGCALTIDPVVAG